MPNPSQIRLQQLSGSLSEVGSGITAATAGVTLAADQSVDVQVLLGKFARALAAIHGSSEMFNATRGVIEHDVGAVRVKGTDDNAAQTTSVVQADSGNANSLSLKLESDGSDVANSFVKLQNVSGTGASAIQIQAAAGGVNIDADGGKLALDGSTGIDIGVEADVAVDLDASTLDIDASGALTIDSATSISIGTNADKPIDIDSTTFDLDASGAIAVTGTSTATYISGDDTGFRMTANAAGNKTLAIVAANSGGGTGIIDVDATGKLSLDGAGGIDIGVAADVAVDVDASTFDLDASAAVTVDGQSIAQVASTGFVAQGQGALYVSGGNGAAGPLGLSGSVVFSSDGAMQNSFDGDSSMAFAVFNSSVNEFANFRGKSIFDSGTTVVGALNALADSVTASEATLLTASITSALATPNAQALAAISGVSNDLRLAAPHQLDLFVNGQLLVSGALADLAAGDIDYTLDAGQPRGVKFAFDLLPGDSVVVIDKL